MAIATIQRIQGKDVVTYARRYKNRATEGAALVPYQTEMTFDPSRNNDSTTTKDGSVVVEGAVETDMGFTFLNNTSKVADEIREAMFNGEKMEFWQVYRNRFNDEGKCFAIYAQGSISEDSTSFDADDFSTREISISVNGEPKRGWVALSDDAQEEIDYVFYGLGAVTDDDKNGSGDAWKDEDAGANAEKPTGANVAVSGVTVDPKTGSVAVGETIKLTAATAPDNATDKTVTWASSDESKATVDNGTVTGIAEGEATITAIAGDKTDTAEITITVAQ